MKKIISILFFIIAVFTLNSQGYEYLIVDGIQVHFTEIRFFDSYGGGGSALASIAVNQTVNLTGDIDAAFSGSVTLNVREDQTALEFGIINIEITGGVGIKGHCYDDINARHVYTKVDGIGYLDAVTDEWSEPGDYDYLQKDYIYYPGDSGETQETTFLPSSTSYALDDTITVSLLVETLNSAYYWDGDISNWDGNHSTRTEFVRSWNLEDPSYFPTGTPVIGITYLPLYVGINETLDSETYVFAISTDDLPVNHGYIDGLKTSTVTLVFDQDDSFYIGRTTHGEPWGGGALYYPLFIPQFVSDAQAEATGSDLTLSFENYSDGQGWSAAESLSGFSRLAVDETGEASYTDDGEHGTTLFYYQRVK
jgi:hypothetical protein